MRKIKATGDAGLTLVELIITISIIGILASVMTLSVSKVGTSANINACRNMFQAYSLAYTTYQSDYSGASPGELSNLAKLGYIDPKVQNNNGFTMQNGVYEIKSYFLNGTTLALSFSASWLSSTKAPPGRAGNLAIISSLDNAIDGTYQLTMDPVFVSDSTWATTVTFVGTLATTSATFSNFPTPPRSLSILSQNSDISKSPPTISEIYLYDGNLNRVRSDLVVPEACAFLN